LRDIGVTDSRALLAFTAFVTCTFPRLGISLRRDEQQADPFPGAQTNPPSNFLVPGLMDITKPLILRG
jgi:hypothetical protein